MERVIPVIDLGKFVQGDGEVRKEVAGDIGEAFHNVGFVGVVNHGIPAELVEAFYNASHQFFALPTDVKRKYEIPGLAGQRGYTAFGKEHAKHSNVGDLKEFFQIGQELKQEDTGEGGMQNVHVGEVPEFTRLGIELYRAFEQSGAHLLRAIAIHLGLDETYFDPRIDRGNSILRSIHYPPITEEPKSAIRAEQHEDINLITLLVGASAGGLQILDLDGRWLPIIPGKDEIVVNVGDMLQRLTNNHLKSTTHRVVNPPREEWHKPRLSIPFFLHPRSDMDLSCLESCITEANPRAHEPISAGEYLEQRLREIGLKT